jgi:hypothetical protein
METETITTITEAWVRSNLRTPRPAPVHTQLTCQVPECTGMSFVVIPGDRAGNVCFRHYQVILEAADSHSET